jgi:hypothetical protein
MEPTDILLESSFPRDRHCQKRRIEPRIVESFSNVTSRSQNYPERPSALVQRFA